MFQNLHGRQAYAARGSGGLQGLWSGGDAQGGRARMSTHQNSGFECRTARGTAESPTSDPQARPLAMSKQSPNCLPAMMTGVEVPSVGHSPSLYNMFPASSRESDPTSPSRSEIQHPVEDPQTRSESREAVGRRTPKEPTGSFPPSSSV
ncbi:unnamed protein product [Prunus armeniaca]